MDSKVRHWPLVLKLFTWKAPHTGEKMATRTKLMEGRRRKEDQEREGGREGGVFWIDQHTEFFFVLFCFSQYGTRQIVEVMVRRGHKIELIMICGGLRRNKLYVSAHADITGKSEGAKRPIY